jgi:allantoicase
MMRIRRTKGAGDWIIVQLKPKDIFMAASDLYKQLERGNSPDFCFHNVTDGQQFRIEVRSE